MLFKPLNPVCFYFLINFNYICYISCSTRLHLNFQLLSVILTNYIPNHRLEILNRCWSHQRCYLNKIIQVMSKNRCLTSGNYSYLHAESCARCHTGCSEGHYCTMGGDEDLRSGTLVATESPKPLTSVGHAIHFYTVLRTSGVPRKVQV